MKKACLSIIPLAAVLMLCGCRPGSDKGNETVLNYKKLTYGKALFQGEANGVQRYVLTLWTADRSEVGDNDYSESDISLELDIATEVSSVKGRIASGDYAFSSSNSGAFTILDSENSALKIISASSYGGKYQRLVAGNVTINGYDGTYEIEGAVEDALDNVLEFTYYGKLTVEGIEPEESVTVDFEAAELSAKTGTYANILWGKDKASDVDGVAVYNGLLYTEDGASFGSYFSESEYGDMWGGFAVSSNRDPEDLGMDYSNQFSVYADAATKFAVGYAFGDWGGEYGNPVIVFSEPVAVKSADIANANKTYHYCVAHPKVGEEEAEEDIWVNLVAQGYDGNGTAAGKVTIPLAQGAQVLGGWKNFDFSGLGTVTRVAFSIESNDTGEYGLNVPAFFCIDNISLQ